MDEENGLELSLGLSFGGSSSKTKSKDGPSDPKGEDRSNSKIMNCNINASDAPFRNFFQTNAGSQDHNGKKTVCQLQPNFWTDVGNRSACAPDGSDNAHSIQSNFMRYQESWKINSKITDAEEEISGSKKRKLPPEDINYQKKHEKIVGHAAAMSKVPPGVTLKNSPISINTEDDSSGENEDVAESEAEGSNSWLVSQREDSAKCSSIPRSSDKHVLNDPIAISSQPQNQHFFSGSESISEQGKVAYGIPLPLQPLTVMTVPYTVPIKVQTSAGASSAAGFTSPCVMQLMPVANGEQAMVQTMSNNNLQVAFGYSPVQLPTLETSSSWVFSSQPQQVSSADVTANSQNPEDEPKRSFVQAPLSSALAFDGKTADFAKAGVKHVPETGTSSFPPREEENKGNKAGYRQRETANQPSREGFPPELPVIRPGLASNVNFGGCGSYPDLPWVSTTGPNGKTISGVTYKYNQNLVKIVCACHGLHMSPEEFIQHASSGDASNPESNTSFVLFAPSNPAASAQN